MQRTEVPSEILGILNSALLDKRNRGLKGAEKVLVDGIWLGLKYEEIADQSDHKVQYLKNTVGPALFRDLREAIDPKISKTNFRALLEQRLEADRTAVRTEVVPQEVKLDASIDRLELQGVPASDDEIYGREQEVEKLKEYMKPGGAALVCVYSLGGFGKTTLVGKVVREVDAKFEKMMWISLQEQQSYQRVLELMLQRFEEQGGDRAALRGATALDQCLQMMQVATCLVVLEDFHRVLPSWSLLPPEGEGQENWLAYQQLLRRLNQRSHRSCLVVVSRVQPRFFSEEMGSSRVRSIELEGLDEGAIEQLLIGRKVAEQVDSEVLKRLWKHSMGHPLTLKLSAARIRNLFDGDIQAFLNTGSLAYGGLKEILAEEFKLLTLLEKEVLYWLLINRDPVEARTPIRFSMLKADVLTLSLVDAEEKLGDCLDSLMRKSLIDSEKGAYRLHELVGDYVRECLIEDILAELVGDDRKELYFLNHCALVKVKSNDSIRQRQVREVITPIVQRLRTNVLKRPEDQKIFFTSLVERARHQEVPDKSYLVSNVVQLCRSLEINLAGFDFSDLYIHQANFRGIELHNVSFVNSTVLDSMFNNIFGGVLCVRLSPDGRHLATSDTDGSVLIWDCENHDSIRKIKAHAGWILHIRFSADGKLLVSASEDETCSIWSVSNGDLIRSISANKRILALDLSPDGKTIAVAGEGGEILLWDVEDGHLISNSLIHEQGFIWSCVFSPDGQSLLSASTDQTVRILNLRDGSIDVLFKEPSIQCRSLVYSADGRYLARVSDRNVIKVWDIENQCEIASLKGHSKEIWTVIFGSDRNELISAGTDKQICVWDILKQEIVRAFQGHDATIYSIAYSARDSIIISGSADQKTCFWDYFQTNSEQQQLDSLQGFSSGIRSIAFLKEATGYRLISGGSEQKIYSWNISPDVFDSPSIDGRLIQPKMAFEKVHSGFIWSVSASLHQDSVVSAGDDGEVILWDAKSGKKKLSLLGHSWNIFSVDFSWNGDKLVSGSLDETIRVWNFSTDRSSRIISNAHSGGVRHVKFTADDRRIISCGHDGNVKLWDLKTLELLHVWSGHRSFVQSFDFNLRGDRLISCGDDKTIRIWDLLDFSSGENLELEILRDIHSAWIRDVCFHPNSDLFASCGEDGLVCLWSLEAKNVVWRSYHDGPLGVKCVTFSPDGKLLASGADDGTVKLWEVAKMLEGQSLFPLATLRTIQPYQGLDISNASFSNEQQRKLLRQLGAVDRNLLFGNNL
jgi:WD40 repeat protein